MNVHLAVMESHADHEESETSHSTRGSQQVQTDQPNPNNEQKFQKSYAQETMTNTRRKPNLLDHQVGYQQQYLPSNKVTELQR
jgi:hypothetical protein